MTLIDEALRQELSQLYSAKDRIYHSLTHVEALLDLFERNRSTFADPEAVEAAIWFHDAIYDTHAKDNEHRSAELAARRLTGRGYPLTRVDTICFMIEATATHNIPASVRSTTSPALLTDTDMFLDMDLSILGAPDDDFDTYEAAVRREYAWVDENGWRDGRKAVLMNFLARRPIFASELFRNKFEEQARRNIVRSLLKLGVVV